MKKLLLIGAGVLCAAGCSMDKHHLTPQSEEIVDAFDSAANSYHQEMGHNPLEELTADCQFARDYRLQLDALETRLERIDQSGFCPQHCRLQALSEAVARLGRTARWDTGARGPAYAELKFKTDAGWKTYFHKLCRSYGEKL